jgi:protein-disulfide isomerase
MKIILLLVCSAALSLLVACAPSAKQIKEAVEKDPSIVFVAIEKDPGKFMEVVQKASQLAQQKQQESAGANEAKAREEEFKNPLKPAVDDARPMFGNKSAKVTIVEYTDFECPYCSRGAQTIKQVLVQYPKDVRVLIKHLPLDFHPKALPAAKYFEALRMQSNDLALKFHDEMFTNQETMKSKGEDFMKATAKKLGANMQQLSKNLSDSKLQQIIDADVEEAKKFGISGTPGFIINGVSLRGAYPVEEFKKIIYKHLTM